MVKGVWFILIAWNENNEKQAEIYIGGHKIWHFLGKRIDFAVRSMAERTIKWSYLSSGWGGERKLNDSNINISRDGRLAVLLFFLFVILSFDFTCRQQWPFSQGNDISNSSEQLGFVQPDKLVLENYSGAGKKQRPGYVPAKYSPFFFELIPINGADKDILMTVNGIGPRLAEDIVEYRQQFGSFTESTDLQNIKGIGPKRAAKFSTIFTFTEVPWHLK